MAGNFCNLSLTAILAVLLGWLIVAFDAAAVTTGKVAAGVAVLALTLYAARHGLSRIQQVVGVEAQSDGGSDPDQDRHAPARWLFFAGLATMPLLSLRLGGTTLSDLLFLAALALVMIDIAPDLSYRFPQLPPALVVGLALFASGALLSTIASSTAPADSIAVLLRVLYLLVAWFIVGMAVLRTMDHIRTAVVWWAAGVAMCGLYAVAQKAGVTPGLDPTGRAPGLAEHVNDLGALSAVAAVPALALAWITRRWIFCLCAAVPFIGIALSGSVGGAVAVLVALLICMVSRALTKAVLVAVTIGLCMLAYASLTVGLAGTPVERFESTTSVAERQDATLHIRADTIKLAWERIKQDPLIGTGLDSQSSHVYSYLTGRRYAVHNLFVGRWHDSGVLGLIGIVTIVSALLASAWRVVRRSAGADQYLAVSLLAATVAFLVVGMGEPLLYKRYALAPAALALAMCAIYQRRPRVSRAHPQPAPTVVKRAPEVLPIGTAGSRRSSTA